MKKIFLLLFSLFLLGSCTPEGEKYHFEIIPVDSFEVPTSFVTGQTYTIKIFYRRPTICYEFNGFYYHKNENIRTIGVQTLVRDEGTCTPLDLNTMPSEATLNFYVTKTEGSYIFKFYKGEDAEGNNIFEEVEIPVEN